MNNKNINNQAPINIRRKILAGIGALSLFPILKYSFFAKKSNIIACAPEAKNQTMKMLTQDGRLVEVNISKINGAKEKISNKQLQNWIKKEL